MSISDKEFFHLSVSISKALNPLETPLKLKHARSAIISTHRTKESKSFWRVVSKQPLMESRFTAWKFCHLVHKVLREGHPTAIKHSQCHKKMIYEMGKLWGHLQDGVGICIEAYTRLIVTKLEFHEKNPQFAGNLVIDFFDLEKLAGDDINFYFQLGVEIFDYLDDIISLEMKVFTSIKTYRMSSMTPQGQCRLAPLITLIQDSNPLYDLSVRLMFKLHANLPNDILAGHRDRFRSIFNQLKTFYEAVRPLQYFADLIQVPHLPENAPNFTSSVDFGSYIPPVVVVPPEPDLVVENLVDVGVDEVQDNRQNTPETVHITLEQQLREKEDFIRKLEFEVERLRTDLNSTVSTKQEELKDLKDQVSNLNSQLVNTYEELHQVKIEKDNLKLQLTCTPTLEEKASAEEERANATEEKFNKLKSMYTQIRDEHINLLRQHADATKKLNSLAKQNSELVSDKELIKIQFDELIEKQREYKEYLNKTSDLERQEKIHREQYMALVKVHDNLQIQYDNLQADSTAKIAEIIMETNLLRNEIILQKSDHNTTLEKIRNDLFSKSEECVQLYQKLEQFQEEKTEQIVAMDHTNVELIQVNDSLQNELKVLNISYEELKSLNASLELKNNNIRIEFENKISELQAAFLTEKNLNQEERNKNKLQFEQELMLKDVSIQDLTHTISKTNEEIQNTKFMLERLSEEKASLECDIQDLLHQHSNLDAKYKKSLEEIKELQALLKSSQIHGESAVRALLEACIKSSEKLAIRANAEKEFSNVAGTPAYYMMLAEELQNTLNELQIVYKNYSSDNSAVEGLSRKLVLTGHLLSIIQIQGMTVCNTSAHIGAGEEIAEEIKNISKDITAMFQALLMPADPDFVLPKINNLKEKLNSLTRMIHDLSKKSDDKGHLCDLVELELATMDKAIEEAASKIVDLLSTSRAFDSGIKLEVNERILDACTNLMQTIRILVQRSKALQAEIVSLGKGTASEKEFYKRNNQWSEGLISAAKSVAIGANLLVEAANKAVTGEAKNHLNIIVAAQEIAACTAQLVVASRVKAPRESRNLTELSTASRNVTQATGIVVATAKDSCQHLEDSQDLNFSKLTVHQAKTFEMEIQVKVLQLEQDLQSERLKLASFRRNNYRNETE